MQASYSTMCMGIALLWALGTFPAAAHEAHDHSIPDDNGLHLQAAAAVSYLHARQAVPAPRLPGHLGLGDTPDDQRGWTLEHGTVGASVRLGPSPLLAASRDPVEWAPVCAWGPGSARRSHGADTEATPCTPKPPGWNFAPRRMRP